MLHPGWLVGTKVEEHKVVISTDFDTKKIEKQILAKGENLHDLRKQAKRLRYQMELFTDFYGEIYASYLAQVRNIQEVLGSMQDSVVLNEWLEDVLKAKISNQLPTLANLLKKNRYDLWQQWQSLQQQFLRLENRQELHVVILHPDVK